MIINFYKRIIQRQTENPDSPRLKYKEMIEEISKSCGIGRRTIITTLSEYKNQGTVTSPNKKKCRLDVTKKVDDFDKNAIRQKVHSFWLNRNIPTLTKILTAVNEDNSLQNFKRSTFHKMLKSMNFVYQKKKRNSALLERNDIVSWRRRYLESIKHYRQQGRPIYYLDETWVNAGETTNKTWVDKTVNSPRDAFLKGLTTGQKKPIGKGKQLIVLHIGSSDGFVEGGLLCFESKTNSTDYHHEMNGDTFYKWFVNILPFLKKNAIVVMDNAPYHSVKTETIPNMSWKKQDIINWLENKGQLINSNQLVKSQLIDQVEQLRPRYNTYVIDEYAKSKDIIVLRLPPYHFELNPIELAWASVKNYVRMSNTTFKLKDVQELLVKGVEHVTPEMWTNFIRHTIKEEDKFWKIDHISDELIDNDPEQEEQHVMTVGTGDTDTSSDSDSDSSD